MDDTTSTHAATTSPPPVTPHRSQPGTLRQQLQAVELYLDDPWQCPDRDRRWEASRRTVMHHARGPA